MLGEFFPLASQVRVRLRYEDCEGAWPYVPNSMQLLADKVTEDDLLQCMSLLVGAADTLIVALAPDYEQTFIGANGMAG
jgi:hypothetical protein